jgi:hypothetical protein
MSWRWTVLDTGQRPAGGRFRVQSPRCRGGDGYAGERSHDASRAIAIGLERSGRVILSAATIMVIVFASFLLATNVDLKELGFALAVVVLIDAAITRRLLVPAALRLLGGHAWTWPARGHPRSPYLTPRRATFRTLNSRA